MLGIENGSHQKKNFRCRSNRYSNHSSGSNKYGWRKDPVQTCVCFSEAEKENPMKLQRRDCLLPLQQQETEACSSVLVTWQLQNSGNCKVAFVASFRENLFASEAPGEETILGLFACNDMLLLMLRVDMQTGIILFFVYLTCRSPLAAIFELKARSRCRLLCFDPKLITMPHAVFLMKIRYCFQPRNQKQNCFELIGWAGYPVLPVLQCRCALSQSWRNLTYSFLLWWWC